MKAARKGRQHTRHHREEPAPQHSRQQQRLMPPPTLLPALLEARSQRGSGGGACCPSRCFQVTLLRCAEQQRVREHVLASVLRWCRLGVPRLAQAMCAHVVLMQLQVLLKS